MAQKFISMIVYKYSNIVLNITIYKQIKGKGGNYYGI